MIHSTAIIDPAAQLGSDVRVGPYSIIGEHVVIGDNTAVGPHVVINGHTEIGRGNHFFQYSSIGEANQDKKYLGEPTKTRIGDHNVFRECCTVHRGTVQDNGITTIGNNGLFMAYSHIAHDCVIGSDVIMANNATLGGHVEIGDRAILGGFSGVHQFCRIGQHAFLGIRSTVTQDITPFLIYADNAARTINSEGLKRGDYSAADIAAIKQAHKLIYRSQLRIEEAVSRLEDMVDESVYVQLLIDFIRNSKRGLAR